MRTEEHTRTQEQEHAATPAVRTGSAPDTVRSAAEAPDAVQPYAELGLADEEYARIRQLLGRRPTSSELAMYSVMWSEHCSYKSSKVHLRQFGEKAPHTDTLLVGMGENAGVVDIGHGYAVTFKIESHNHPSYVEPYQGAATGVGGIVRDILTMGARPVAVMDALRFGPATAPDTRRVLPGVAAGIGGYGNCLGLPNIGGEIAFDACYAANPLVNALCVGVMRREDLKLARASGSSNKVILLGAGTGPDGIGGASVLASAAFAADTEGDGKAEGAGGSDRASKRPSVQVGDPFLEKLLVECCLELFGAGLVVGIQDLGAAGLSCAISELASAGTGGMRIDLDAVPLRDPTLAPEEILMSESQERMMAIAEPGHVDAFLAVCAKWDVPATVIGEVTDVSAEEAARGGRLVATWRGEVVVDVPPRTVAHEGPVYDRPSVRPADLDAVHGDDPSYPVGGAPLLRPRTGDELRETLLRLAGSPNLTGKAWVTEQYDRYVQGNTVLATPDDAGVLRIDDALPFRGPARGNGSPHHPARAGLDGLGIAVSTDGNSRYVRLDPYAGTQLALAEAYRNVAATGARPLAVTDCLNFGSPEDPAVMWQFAEAVRGLADGCQELGVPVTGGNVSFYNQTGDAAIHPTPIVGVLGVMDDVRRRLSLRFTAPGASVLLLGQTLEEFGGSEWAHAMHGHLGGRPPRVDLPAERALASTLEAGAREGLLTAAHDLSEGGLAQALAESCLHGGHGCRVTLPARQDPFVTLFSESAARAVVAVRPGAETRMAVLCAARGVPYTPLGVVGGDALDFEGLFRVSLDALREVHEATFPALFG